MAFPVESLIIPIAGSEEVVTVPVDQLPEDPEEILDILRAEEAPLGHWLDFAKAYLVQNKTEQYLHILEEGSGAEVKEFFESKGEGRPERIQFMCALAAYFVHLGKQSKDRNAQAEHFSKANNLLVMSRSEDPQEQLPYIGLGFMHMAKNETKNAIREFELAVKKTHNGRRNVSGHLALAALHYGQGDFTEALSLYATALQEQPDGPAEIRLGLASCHFRLGHLTQAKAAFDRVLELDPDCGAAAAGLALYHLARPSSTTGMLEGAQFLRRAYDADPLNPGVLCLLAHLHLLRGEFQLVKTLAKTANDVAESDAIKAEALTYLARAAHALGDRSQAPAVYLQACRLDGKLPMPHYGLAQMYLFKKEFKNAVSELEAVLRLAPGNYDALKLLAALYPQLPTKVDNALAHFQAAAEKDGTNPAVLEMLGELLAPSQPVRSLKSYDAALALHRAAAARGEGQEAGAGAGESSGRHVIPPTLMNNAAVLNYRGGNMAAALDLMQEAVQENDKGDTSANSVTMRFNLARMREAAGEIKAATAAYEALLEEEPGYIECYLRLACIAKAVGHMGRAVEWAERARRQDGGNADALALLGVLHLERRDWPVAHRYLDLLVKGEAKDDPYGLLATGNLNLYTAPSDRRKAEARAKADTFYFKATEKYRKVLTRDPCNIYAANGLGAVLAEQGDLEGAWEVFKMCAEATSASGSFLRMPEVWVNMGTVHLARQDYSSAIKMYENALARFYNNKNVAVMLYLARAYYDKHDLAAAKRTLLKAVHLVPTDASLRFNTALTMQEYAVNLLRRKRSAWDESALEDYTRASSELTTAVRFFRHLQQLGSKRSPVDQHKLKSHIEFCTKTYRAAQTHLQKAQTDLAAARVRREAHDVKVAMAAQEKSQVEEAKAAEARAEEERRNKLAEEARLRLSRLQANWKNTAVVEEATAKGDSSKIKKKSQDVQDAQKDAFFGNVDEDSADDEDYDAEKGAEDAAKAELEAGLASSEDEKEGNTEDMLMSDEEGGGRGARRRGRGNAKPTKAAQGKEPGKKKRSLSNASQDAARKKGKLATGEVVADPTPNELDDSDDGGAAASIASADLFGSDDE